MTSRRFRELEQSDLGLQCFPYLSAFPYLSKGKPTGNIQTELDFPTGRCSLIREYFVFHSDSVFWTQSLLHSKATLYLKHYLGRVKRIWYLSPMRAAKVQASLRIHAVSPEAPLLAHISIESRGTFRQKARSLAPQNGWACTVKICHDGMLKDTNSLDRAHLIILMTKVATLFKFLDNSDDQSFTVL